MIFENNKHYDLFLRVDSANKNNKVINLTVTLSDLTNDNVKVTEEQFQNITLGNVYSMNVKCINNGTRNQLFVSDFKPALDTEITKETENALRVFYNVSPVSIVDLKIKLEKYIKSIKNNILKNIVSGLYNDYEKEFIIYPAATRLHHAYIGGLLYHTVSILELCDKYIEIYPSLDRDYLISGIVLHDIMKIEEYDAPVNSAYSVEGNLLGHIVMGTIKIEKKAVELNVEKSEEVLILKHMLVSHHGQQSFGSPVKPMTKEALLIWYLDTIDSKLRVLEEELDKVEDGSFTNNIMVLDRGKFYKTKKL